MSILISKLYHLMEGDVEFDEIDGLIDETQTKMSREEVESLLSILAKTLNDWNREKNFNDEEVIKVTEAALSSGLIEIQSYT